MAHRASSARLFSLLVVLFLSVIPALAQDTSQKTVTPPQAVPATPAARSKATSAATKARIEQQKALAISLLVSLANEARNFSDQKLRARTLSRIADALWEPDPEQGRALLRKAWDAAEAADQETARRAEEESKQQPDGGFALAAQPNLRSEVLRLAAKHDRALGEELLDKFKEARKQETTDASSPERPSPFEAPAAIKQRLRLANQLLDIDVERSLQFADPALGTITMDGINFLSSLRDKNAAAGDQRYTRMLAIAETDLKSDANTISLLSSYLFTPHLFVTFDSEGGQSSSSINQSTPPPDVNPALRNAYLRMAAQLLMRPSPSREQDHTSSGLPGKYLVIRRLMPVFEKYLPKETADQLWNEMAVLGQGVEEDVRDLEDNNPIQRVGRRAEDVEKSLLDRIERAKTSEERDSLYVQLAAGTAQLGDMRARDFTEKIEDSELRKQARPYVDTYLARDAVEKKDTDKALTLAAKGELTHLQRAWLLAQAAKAFPAANRDKALEVVAAAAEEARRIDVSDADRPRALLAVANAFWVTDRTRAWETMLEVVKASNSAAGFNGEDGRLMWRLQTKTMRSLHSTSVDDFNLPGIFRELAKENATQAIEIARSFEGEAPRATALIAVARTLLSEKK